jgi:hypothetical protein
VLADGEEAFLQQTSPFRRRQSLSAKGRATADVVVQEKACLSDETKPHGMCSLLSQYQWQRLRRLAIHSLPDRSKRWFRGNIAFNDYTVGTTDIEKLDTACGEAELKLSWAHKIGAIFIASVEMVDRLLSTHPPIEKRIQALQIIEAEQQQQQNGIEIGTSNAQICNSGAVQQRCFGTEDLLSLYHRAISFAVSTLKILMLLTLFTIISPPKGIISLLQHIFESL